MASIPIYNRSGEKVGKYEIDPTQIAPKINAQLLHDAVVMYQANRRQGTHKTKDRSEVAGTTKKMYRQKGTGNARAGSRRSPLRRGGGHIFALRNRDYSYQMPRKATQAATRMAIAKKLLSDDVVIIDDLAFAEPKTKEFVGILKALKLAGQSTLVTIAALDQNIYRSARNIAKVSVAPVSDLNALTVLSPKKLLVTKAALDAIAAAAQKATSKPA